MYTLNPNFLKLSSYSLAVIMGISLSSRQVPPDFMVMILSLSHNVFQSAMNIDSPRSQNDGSNFSIASIFPYTWGSSELI
ncbi:MAG: hypothetical protein BWZ01_02880 [Deltaproteobacteria bacterium ADurb.BinA179]|nr:MAG: hypothetical protein BWZ01_02880 [Deltaproteobacteria bacterium ADurb.BinA179]